MKVVHEPFVYFILTPDRSMMKIGFTTSMKARLEQLAIWCPFPLTVEAFVSGSMYDERALHLRYLDLHSHKEWFRTSDAMFSDVERIRSLGALPEDLRATGKIPSPLFRLNYPRPEAWRLYQSECMKRHHANKRKNKSSEAAL